MANILLRDVGKVLLDIYQLYFKHELKCGATQSEQMILKLSQKALFDFLKDFEVCPGIVTKAAAYKIFVDDSRQVAVYTPTGLDILTKSLNKESRAVDLHFEQLPKLTGSCFTFFKFQIFS